MAISARAAGTWAELTVDGTVAIPVGAVTGDRMFLLATWKAFSVTATVAGWTEITEFADGAVAVGAGTGSVKVGAWYKDHDGSEADPTLAFSAGVIGAAVIVVFDKGATETWFDPDFATAAIASATTWSATGNRDVGIIAGDLVIELVGFRDDSTTMTRLGTTALDAAGVTWAADYVEYPATHFSTTTGNDLSADAGHRIASSGTSTAAPTGTGVLLASETGAALFIRQRAAVLDCYTDTVLADSPVAYWRLGETGGTNANDEIGTADGTYTGGHTLNQASALSGDPDPSVLFNGTSGYVTVPDSAPLDLGDGPLSIELWFKRVNNTDVAERNLISKGLNAYALTFSVSGDEAIAFAKDSVSVIVKETGTTDDTNWHYVLFTKNGAAVKLYKDGADVTGSVSNATLANTTDALNIGRDIAAGGLFWGGSIDEVAIYNTVLTRDQAAEHYAARTVSCSAPSQDIGALALLDASSAIYAPTLAPKSTLTLGLIDGVSAIYAPTLLPQPVTVGALALLDGGAALYAPTVLANQLVALGLIDASSAIYAPTVLPQPVTGGPLALIDAGSAIYAPTVLPQAVTLTLGLIDAAPDIFSPTLAPQPVTVSLDLLDAGATIYAPIATPVNTITLGGGLFDPDIFDPDIFDASGVLDGGRAIYALTVIAGAATITLPLTDAGPAIYAPTVLPQPVTVTLGLLDAESAIFAPLIAPAQFVGALDLLDGGSAIYAPTVLLGAADAALPLIDAGALIFAPTLTPTNLIELDLIDAGPTTYAPSLGFTVALDLIDAGADIYEPVVTPVNGVSLDVVDAGSAIFDPTLTVGAVAISLDLIDAEPAVYSPALTTGAVGVTVELLESVSAIYAPTVAFGLLYVELPVIDAGSAIYAPDIQSAAFLTLDLIESASAIFEPTITVGAADAALGLIDAGSAIFALTLATSNAISLDLVDGGPAIYAPTLAPTSSLTLAILDGVRAIYAPLLVTKNDIALAVLDGGRALYDPTLIQQTILLSLPMLDAEKAIYALSLPGDPFGRHVHGTLGVRRKPTGSVAVQPTPTAGVTTQPKPKAEVEA